MVKMIKLIEGKLVSWKGLQKMGLPLEKTPKRTNGKTNPFLTVADLCGRGMDEFVGWCGARKERARA